MKCVTCGAGLGGALHFAGFVSYLAVWGILKKLEQVFKVVLATDKLI